MDSVLAYNPCIFSDDKVCCEGAGLLYENGARVKGFAKKLHKQKMKKQFIAHRCMCPEYNSYEDYLARWYLPEESSCNRYWKKLCTTVLKQFSKDQTNRRIRSRYRDAIQKAEYDSFPSCHGTEYQKHFADW